MDENGGTFLLTSFLTRLKKRGFDIQQRINKTRGAFFRLKNAWSASNISLHLKMKLFNMVCDRKYQTLMPITVFDGDSSWTAYIPNGIQRKSKVSIKCRKSTHRIYPRLTLCYVPRTLEMQSI
jgi:hypothetical protein